MVQWLSHADSARMEGSWRAKLRNWWAPGTRGGRGSQPGAVSAGTRLCLRFSQWDAPGASWSPLQLSILCGPPTPWAGLVSSPAPSPEGPGGVRSQHGRRSPASHAQTSPMEAGVTREALHSAVQAPSLRSRLGAMPKATALTSGRACPHGVLILGPVINHARV